MKYMMTMNDFPYSFEISIFTTSSDRISWLLNEAYGDPFLTLCVMKKLYDYKRANGSASLRTCSAIVFSDTASIRYRSDYTNVIPLVHNPKGRWALSDGDGSLSVIYKFRCKKEMAVFLLANDIEVM